MINLRKKIFKGIAWRSTVDISQTILQIVFTAILARLLTKIDFGIVAMALIFTRFIRAVTQIGFSATIIQDQYISDEHLSAIFLYSLASNFFISVICCISAPLAANFFNEPKLIQVLQVLSWIIFISALGFPEAIMRKKFDFKRLSIIEIISMFLGNFIGVGMALTGFGMWSLVGRLMIQRLSLSAGIWLLAGWKPIQPNFQGVGRHFKFGLNIFAAHIVNFFSQNLVAIITGKYIGTDILGAYSIAYNLAIVPAQKVQRVLGSVMMPAFSHIQEMTDRFNSRLQLSVFSLGLFFIPAMFGLSVISESLVTSVYGIKWEIAGSYLAILSFVGLFKGMQQILRPSILSKGHPDKILKISIAEAAIGVPLYILSVQHFKIEGLIFSYLIASFVALLITINYSQKVTLSRGFFFRETKGTFIAASVMYCSLLSLNLLFDPGIILLFVKLFFGILIYITTRYFILNHDDRKIIYEIPFIGRFFEPK